MENVIVAILVIIPGVWSGDWQVTVYSQCALKGTSVVMKCSYDYPFAHFVTSVHWSKGEYVSGNWRRIPLNEISPYPDHFQYLGNRRGDCTLRINTVQHADEGAYFFSFVTTFDRWTSKTYAHLTIKDLTAVVKPATVTEGDRVHLSCESGCPSLRPSVAWFREGQEIRNSIFQAMTKDAGRYSCVVRETEASRSASVVLNVQYRPKEVALSLSPSAIIKGVSVSFTCSSDANPAVTQSGYSVYKDGQLTSSGQDHTISNIQPGHSGRYYCQAWNGITWKGVSVSKSPEVNLDVKYPPENVSVSMEPVTVVEGNSVNLTCSSDANPAAHSYTWYWRTAAPGSGSLLLVGSGQVLSLSPVEASHTGHYLCQAGNPLGENNSTELLLEMKSDKDNLYLLVLAGVGVTLLLALLVAFLWFWKRQKQADKQQTVFESRLSERGSSSSAIEMQNDSLYGNIQVFASSPRPPNTAQAIPLNTALPRHAGQQSKDEGEAIIYATVTIKPRKKTRPQHHTSDDWPKSGDRGDSVIYANITKSS